MRVRVREAARAGGLVALLLVAACSGVTTAPQAVELNGAEDPVELREILDSIRERDDPEAWITRARIHDRLRHAAPGEARTHLARGDEADHQVLSGPARRELKEEAARRLWSHFEERAQSPARCRLTFQGVLGPVLRRYVMLTAAAAYCAYASGGSCRESVALEAEAAAALAECESLGASARKAWGARASALTARAGRAETKAGPDADLRKFCEDGVARHLEEAARTADSGTREKAARGDPGKVEEWYLRSLVHYAVAGESLCTPTAGETHALSGMEIVARSLADVLCPKE